MDIKNILVPVDFSPPSRLAVNHGVSLTREFHARLTLMHVVESPVAEGFALAHALEPGAEILQVGRQHHEQAMRMLSALIAPEDQDDLDLRIVIKSGEIKDEIASAIAEQHADLVVMGTHGRGLFGRWLVGSVTESLLRRVSVPVLTVCRATSPLTFDRVLFATDLSESSKPGFQFAVDMARLTRSTIVVIHVVEQVSVTYDGQMVHHLSPRDLEEVQTRLANLVAEAKRQELKVETALVGGVAAEAILKAAEENAVDLILLAVQKKGLVDRALLGTTAERVIREAGVPVLSIPAER